MTGSRTLEATERVAGERLPGVRLDEGAMWAVSGIYRATAAIRNHLEQGVLRDTGLTWTGFIVLWVVWIWGDIETASAAEEAGISKGTLTGVVKTLESYRYVSRSRHATDGRRVVLRMGEAGAALMARLFPAVNRQESWVVGGLSARQQADLTGALRTIADQLRPDPLPA
jgi:MarR family transcriptional regulator, organic hydroperoxide resistance regulator